MPADAWAKLATSIANLASSIFNTREEAYNRKKDKQQEKAIHCAEQMIEKLHLMFNFIFESIDIPEDKKGEYERLKLLIYRKINQFNKYD